VETETRNDNLVDKYKMQKKTEEGREGGNSIQKIKERVSGMKGKNLDRLNLRQR
jgi:hypothetical protein